MPAVAIARPLLPYALELLKTLSGISGRRIILNFHRQRLQQSIRVLPVSDARTWLGGAWNWNRKKIPLYGSFAAAIPVSVINVPSWVYDYPEPVQGMQPSWTWTTRLSEKPYERLGIPVPQAEMQMHFKPPRGPASSGYRGPPAEAYRVRRDTKMGLYGSALSTANAVLRYPTELMDAALAYQQGAGDPVLVAQNLVFNEFIDRAVGYRARALKKHVYDKAWYRAPIGLDMAHRLLTGR